MFSSNVTPASYALLSDAEKLAWHVQHRAYTSQPLLGPSVLISPQPQLDTAMQDNIIIKIGNTRFSCQRSLLRRYSSALAISGLNADVVNFPQHRQVSIYGFYLAYQWMCLQNQLHFDDVVPLMQVAGELRIKALWFQCWKVVRDRVPLKKMETFHVYVATRGMHRLPILRGLMLMQIAAQFMYFVGREEFLDMCCEDLVELIRDDDLSVNTEIETFFAVLRWLNRKPHIRKTFMLEVMSAVRFSHMPMSFLFKLKDATHRYDQSEPDKMYLAFLMDARMQGVLDKAIICANGYCQHRNDAQSGMWIEQDMQVCLPRKWAFDCDCKYHLPVNMFPYTHDFKVSDFEEYLEFLQQQEAERQAAEQQEAVEDQQEHVEEPAELEHA